MVENAGHRRFAAVWELMSRHEAKDVRDLREEVTGQATGNMLELGYGVGSNWPFLPEATTYTGIEPDPHMRERALPHVPHGRSLTLGDGDAEALAFPDSTFDTVLGTLVFCTIGDPSRALQEVRRVLKPGGQFLFLEHVRAKNRFGAKVQDGIAPLWRKLGGGCNPNRDTLSLLQASGFEVGGVRNVKVGPLPAIVGSAKPATGG